MSADGHQVLAEIRDALARMSDPMNEGSPRQRAALAERKRVLEEYERQVAGLVRDALPAHRRRCAEAQSELKRIKADQRAAARTLAEVGAAIAATAPRDHPTRDHLERRADALRQHQEQLRVVRDGIERRLAAREEVQTAAAARLDGLVTDWAGRDRAALLGE